MKLYHLLEIDRFAFAEDVTEALRYMLRNVVSAKHLDGNKVEVMEKAGDAIVLFPRPVHVDVYDVESGYFDLIKHRNGYE